MGRPAQTPLAQHRHRAVAFWRRGHWRAVHCVPLVVPAHRVRPLRKVQIINEIRDGRWRDRILRDILPRRGHNGCGGLAAKVELLSGIEGASSRLVRRIVLRGESGCLRRVRRRATLRPHPGRFLAVSTASFVSAQVTQAHVQHWAGKSGAPQAPCGGPKSGGSSENKRSLELGERVRQAPLCTVGAMERDNGASSARCGSSRPKRGAFVQRCQPQRECPCS
jgi:hypothetical protein